MTKNEAIELERQCELLLSKQLGFECMISLSLNGRLRIQFDDSFINLSSDFSHAQYVKFIGYFDELLDYCDDILKCVQENRELFEKLVWSYEHILELSDNIT